MISGWVWALKMCPCTREASPNLWRPSRMSTSFSLVLRRSAPTRSLWMRGRCSLKRHRYLIFSVNIRLCRFVRGTCISLLLFWLSALSVRCQVGEITKIMKAYINMIVKKRCSVKSVSSYGSNWIRWLIWQDTKCTRLQSTRRKTNKRGEEMQRNAQKTLTYTVFQSFWQATQKNFIQKERGEKKHKHWSICPELSWVLLPSMKSLNLLLALISYTGHFSHLTWNVMICFSISRKNKSLISPKPCDPQFKTDIHSTSWIRTFRSVRKHYFYRYCVPL